ncbi:MAG: DEAD/DEAH box helicase family protein [Candidatus Hydrogenedentes bacterium]|nr:DEAD/DEAH box helicase family protein [Candidatus Hydrogenedentota bacterium]
MEENRVAANSGIIDNQRRGKVAEFLKAHIVEGSALSVVSAYFNIYAYGALSAHLDRIGGMRFLFGEPGNVTTVDPERSESKAFTIQGRGLSLENQLHQKEVALRCARWIEDKAEIRSIRESNLLHGKLYHIHDGHREHALLGSSNFTLRGLGVAATPNIELNLVVDGDRDRADLKAWFDELWGDADRVEDVKQKVLETIAKQYTDHSPEFVYFKTLFHVFDRFLQEGDDDARLFDRTAIVDTDIWRALYDFQKDGVKGAINKINAHNGCILADSVGLGKTYTALGVIKYFELRNHRVLVLCPKKLKDNWTVYLAQNNSTLNPFLRDRFAYTVLAHTDLSRDGGQSDGIDLGTLNWGNYDLVVIDESHNFRNNTRGRQDEDGNVIRKSRYERLMKDIIEAGVKTKVLLLSATPVNNDLRDLRNQIYIATENNDNAFSESFGVPSINATLSTAQKTFTEWARGQGDKDVRVLMDRLPAGFFTLLDELTIARSRKHIQRYYKATLAEIGSFPRRLKPISLISEIDLKGRFLSYDRLNDEIANYQLCLFNPSRYVREKFQAIYQEDKYKNLSQANRERFLIGMMKVNFLKRLESSVHSFAVTMARTVDKIEVLEKRLRAAKEQGSRAVTLTVQEDMFAPEQLEIEMPGDEWELSNVSEVIGRREFQIKHLDVDQWLKDLAKDKQQLSMLSSHAQAVTADRDAKLRDLRGIIEEKVKHPTVNSRGEANRKVIVFCAFADTAAYLYENLETWAREELGIHIALVSGGTRPNRTTLGRPNYTDILVNFAPRAKQRDKMPAFPQNEEIDLLIATDCISEGQNLQDCDLLVNYDIHWNPVRIIQRFGRIDRIGSLNKEIQLVNFWPTPDLNKYINLKNRVEARMALVDLSATAEDNILQADDLRELIQADLRYRDRQLLRLKDEILDLEDFNESVALSEFNLNDFRMELANYIAANRERLEKAPLGLYALALPDSEYPQVRPGVIFCLRHTGEGRGNEAVNPLHPYFLVYIRDDGEVRYTFTSPKQILEIYRSLCLGVGEPWRGLCDLFDRETDNGRDMAHYSALLQKAVASIAATFRKRAASGLQSGRGFVLPNAREQVQEDTDLELITWLVIKEDIA